MSPSNAGTTASIPDQGTKIPHASQPKIQNIKQKQYCNKFNRDLLNGHMKTILKKLNLNRLLANEIQQDIKNIIIINNLVIFIVIL